MAKRRCRLCNRRITWWRHLIAGICDTCSYRIGHGGSPLRWLDDEAQS